MYKATYSDYTDRVVVGYYHTLEEGAAACHEHLDKWSHEVLCEEYCDQGGFDMAASISSSMIRLYAVDKVIK